ncbi:MAG: helix-turn-helix domain-containing protein [Prevotella sp.]|nr:helix-turn-helix domain-containing protein [Bacteroidaceae bacterium]MBQ8969656.1 helix-turn-helix domain-containing protein [Bacteroidaceae bacterium]MBQ9637866.1 helix-turn-helix domain-containing protein [Prevotella sp.]
MAEKIYTMNDAVIADALSSMRKAMRRASAMMQECRPVMDGERYVTDKELSEVLKVTRRTLQQYRNDGIIPYITMGGKVLYRESDVKALLERNYVPAM